MPTRYVDPAPGYQAPARSPWWVASARSVAGTARDLRGRPAGPTPMRMVTGPDGAPAWVPVEEPATLPATILGWLWRTRRTLAPLPAVAGYYALNAATITDPRTVAWAALAAPLIGAGIWLMILGGDDRTRRTLTILAATLVALEAWWLLPSAPPGGGLAIGGLAVAASAYRFRTRPHPERTPMRDVPWQVARWDDHVGDPGAPALPATLDRPAVPARPPGLLPGSVAHLIEEVYPPADDVTDGEIPDENHDGPAVPAQPIGFRLAIDLVRGRQEVASVRSKLGLLAGIYGVDKAGMVIDEVGNETRLKLTVTRRAFLNEPHLYRRPTLNVATGRFVWQILADGTHGYCQVWIPRQGVRMVWIIGAMGGGKSGAVDCYLGNVMSAGIAVLDAVDLKGGASIPHWRYRALRFGTLAADALAALLRGVMLTDYRYDLMARQPAVTEDGDPVLIDGRPALGRTWVDPSPEWPIYVLLIEEWTQIAMNPLAIRWAARIAALGRQCLVQFVPTTQPANLDLAFGGNRDLRTNIQAGNVHVFWTDQVSGNLATATNTIDLSRIPKGQAGVGHLVGPAQTRDVQGRSLWVKDPWPVVEASKPGTLGARELAILDAADALSAGGTPADVAADTKARFPGDPEWAAAVDRVFALHLSDVKPAPAAPGTSATPTAGGVTGTFGAPAPEPERTEGQRTILAALTEGPATAADLRAALGAPDQPVTDQALRGHLNALLDAGLVERAGHGRYQLTAETTKE